MRFHPTMHSTYTCWAPGTPEEVTQRLSEGVAAFELKGSIGDDTFKLQPSGPGMMSRNSWRPILRGMVTRAGEGSLIEVRSSIHPFVLVFTALHAIPFLGLTWLIGLLAYGAEIERAEERVFRWAGATADDPDEIAAKQVISDPAEEGAETSAPWSLNARSELDGVRFGLRGKPGVVTARLTVNATEVVVASLNGRETAIRWDELALCEVQHDRRDRPSLLLATTRQEEPVLLPVAGHTQRDLDWLVTYLRTRTGRWRVPRESRDAVEQEAKRFRSRVDQPEG